MNNNLYNLMMQATVEHVSLWRMKNDYKNDSLEDNEVSNLWENMIKEKESHIEKILNLIKKEIIK